MRVLVIRLGALGDMALSFPAFAALRAHHMADHISLLTTAPYAGLAQESPWFNEVRLDRRPGWFDLPGLWRLRRQLTGFDLVYDLQTSSRSSRYFTLAGRPAWSGIAPGCSLPDPDPRRDLVHTVARQRGQLAAAGVGVAPLNLDFLRRHGPVLDGKYALLVPGTSPAQGGAKRWPVGRFAAVATHLSGQGMRPVVVGGPAEADDAATILTACPAALNLVGRTSLEDLAGLASRAALALGGDTGPIHLAAMMGCPTIALFSRFSDPALAAPVGNTRLIRAARLDEIGVDEVIAAMLGLAPGD